MALHRKGSCKGSDLFPWAGKLCTGLKTDVPDWGPVEIGGPGDRCGEQAPVGPAERQSGICFLGKVNYNRFIERYLGKKEGLIVELETGNIIGRHQGYWFHTIGQRKGLGLSGGPWFVIKKDVNRNIVYVSKGYDTKYQYGNVINLQGFSFITKDPWGDFEGKRDHIQDTSHTRIYQGHISKKGDLYTISSELPVQGIAAGQFGVVYDLESRICLGSGMII